MAHKSIKWYGGGIYSKTRTKGDGIPAETFYVRAWIPSERRMRTWKLKGHTIKQAERHARRIVGDPEKAVAEREAARTANREKQTAAYTIEQLYADFTANYRARSGTADYYRNVLKRAVSVMGKMSVASLTPATFDRYLAKRRSEKTKSIPRTIDGKRVVVGAGKRLAGESTLRKETIAFGTMLKWGKRRGLVAVNVLADYEKPREPGDRVTRALTLDEEQALLGLLPPLERDVVEWAIYSGMRRSEILMLTWPGIDRGRGVVHVVGTKTGKARVLPLSLSERLPAILERHPRHTKTPLLFHDTEGKPLDVDRLNGVIVAAMKSACIQRTKGVMWNLFRKSWSSRLYANGKVLPQDEAAWGGHSIAVAMKHYVEFSPAAQERAAGALDALQGTGANTGAGKQ
jgi:integrase